MTIVSAPSKGTLAAAITSGVGGYTPNAGATGTDTFRYYLSDVNGLVSNTVTVQVQLGGADGGARRGRGGGTPATRWSR